MAMFKIGDFSQLAQVSVRMLRHYDHLGLLQPGHVDPWTNYRYYTLDQLPRLHRIQVLQGLGLPLKQIGQVLDEHWSAETLHTLLTAKRREIEDHLRDEAARLNRVAAHIRQIEQGGPRPATDVALKAIPRHAIVATRAVVPSLDAMPNTRTLLFERLYAWLDAHAIAPGMELVVYHNPAYTDVAIDMSVAVVTDASHRVPPHTDTTDIMYRVLPAAPVAASVIHRGKIRGDIPDVVSALYAWLGTHGYTSTGPYREVHLFGRELAVVEADTADDVVFELHVPVEKF